MISEHQRTDLIPELDQFADQADKLRKELDHLLDKPEFYKVNALAVVLNTGYKLVKSLREASDSLKLANTDRIRAYVIDWYRFRVELDVPEDEIIDPEIESITYAGNDRWEILMISKIHGREKVVIDSDTASWDQVYSADPM